MQRTKLFKFLLIGGGIFNILVSSMYIFPLGAYVNIELLSWIHIYFMLEGAVPSSSSLHGLTMLYLNGFGIVDVCLGVLLIYNSRDILNRSGIAFFDAIARLLFAFFMIESVLYQDVSTIAIAFAIIELILASMYIYLIWLLKLKVW